MYHSGHLRILLATAAVMLAVAETSARPALPPFAGSTLFGQDQTTFQNPNTKPSVRLSWSARPGVSRYRLQLARDPSFSDIVFDLVVYGNTYQVTDLPAGTYFWRAAPLTTKLGEFSSTEVLRLSEQPERSSAQPQPSPSKHAERSTVQPQRSPSKQPEETLSKPLAPANAIVAEVRWRAAIGDIPRPVLAHLRSRGSFDIVGVSSEGVTFAVDAASGVTLWSVWKPQQSSSAPASLVIPIPPLLIQSRIGLDNVIVLFDSGVRAFEGATGRELWRVTLPTAATGGVAVSNDRSGVVFILDSPLRLLYVLNADNGKLVANMQLPNRVIGGPVSFDYQGTRGVLLAYEDGLVEIRDQMGRVVRYGGAASPNTTAPVFVNGSSGGLILVGTKGGLTALNADNLRPVRRLSLKDDSPHGILVSIDLDMDGIAEVIMLTDLGRVVAARASDGKILWQAEGSGDAQSVAFADVNGDRVLDIVISGWRTFGFALSGRDGSILWKEEEDPAVVANYALSLSPRSIVADPFGARTLLVASDVFHTGLRAIEIRQATSPAK